MIVGMAYFLIHVDYVWRWEKTFRFFVHEEECEIRSEIDGIVEKISTHGNMATIHIQGDRSRISYQVSTESISVSEGDHLVQDSFVGTSVEWKAGILLHGLWVTLKASACAMLLGSLIGLFGGSLSCTLRSFLALRVVLRSVRDHLSGLRTHCSLWSRRLVHLS